MFENILDKSLQIFKKGKDLYGKIQNTFEKDISAVLGEDLSLDLGELLEASVFMAPNP